MPHDSALPGAHGRHGLVLACAFAALFAWFVLAPHPAPPPPAAQDQGFSSKRAMAHVQALAQAPRPAGSRANAAAREYLLAQLRAIGLQPEVQVDTARAATADLMANVRVTMAEAHNILVRKPGSAARQGRKPAILATARYDAGATTLGAAGAASSAALLEALRVLQDGPPLDNDLLVVFTDADAFDALGTRAFADAHPWAKRARVALRFDNPGNRGPLALVDAEHADGFALDGWAGFAPQPQGSSFNAWLSAPALSGDAAGLLAAPGAAVLRFATTAGPLGGGPWDIAERLSGDSLQHEGDTMLALLRHFGNARLPAPEARGQVFFPLPGLGMVHYPYAAMWLLTGAACLMGLASCVLAVRRHAIEVTDIVHGAFACLMMAGLATFAAWLCREALPGLGPRFANGLLTADGGVRWQLLGFTLLPAAVFIALQRRVQARIGASAVLLGAFCVLDVAVLLMSWRAPGTSYVLAWPLLAAQGAWLVLASRPGRRWAPQRRLALLLAAALPAAILILPAARDSLAVLSPDWLVLPATLACTVPALCGLLLAGLGQRLLVRPLLAAAGACLAVALAHHPVRPALPAPNPLMYLKDALSWQAFWVHPPTALDAWSRKLFPNALHPYIAPYLFGPDSGPVWYAAAPRDDGIAYPYLIIEKDHRPGDVRHVEFLLVSKNRAPEIFLRILGADTLRTSVNGRVLTDRRYRGFKLHLHGMQDRELRFAIDLVGDPPFMVFVQERMPGLPASGLPARPADLRPRLLPHTGTTVSSDVLVFH